MHGRREFSDVDSTAISVTPFIESISQPLDSTRVNTLNISNQHGGGMYRYAANLKVRVERELAAFPGVVSSHASKAHAESGFAEGYNAGVGPTRCSVLLA